MGKPSVKALRAEAFGKSCNSIIMGQAMVLGLIQEGVLSPFFNTSGLRVVEKGVPYLNE
jgi:hypothetical protein